jgi:hypothetical protein
MPYTYSAHHILFFIEPKTTSGSSFVFAEICLFLDGIAKPLNLLQVTEG